jgi:hypothetical protein
MFRSKGVVVAFAILSLCAFAAGCGGDDGASQEQLQQAREDGAKEAQAQAKLNQLERQVKQLRKKGNKQAKSSGSSSSPAASTSSSSSGGGQTSCGGGVTAGANTSCAFAMNVAGEYGSNPGASSIMAYSPVTGVLYQMNCSPNGAGTVCTGGNNASVYIP